MKKLIILFGMHLMLFFNFCNAQKSEDNKEGIFTLKEFYTAYSKFRFRVEYIPSIDSLFKKYCTSRLQKDAKKYMQYGHDLLTNDWGINSEDIQTLVIRKDISRDNRYIITYTTFLDNPDGILQKKDVVLYVTLIKEGKTYNIDSVE